MSRRWFYFGIAVTLNIVAACDPTGNSGGTGGKAGSGGSTGASGGTGGTGAVPMAGTAGDIGVGGFAAGPGSGGTDPGNLCDTDKAKDDDKDGYSEDDGDCNDCDKNVGPGAIEVLAVKDMNGNEPPAADEDCDGMVDNVPMPCDDNLIIEDADPVHGANAIDLCQETTAGEKKW